MNLLAVILCACLAAACNPRAVPVAPIAPAVSRASSDVRAAGKATSRVHVGVEDIAAKVKAMGTGLDSAIAHADARRVNAPGSVDSEEWQTQWEILTEVRVRNMFLESATDATLADSYAAKTLQLKAESKMVDLEGTAVIHDEGVEKIKITAAKDADDAATWRGIKGSMWVILGFSLIFAFIRWGIPGFARLAASLRPTL